MPREAEMMPLPRDEVTPPVTKMCLAVAMGSLRDTKVGKAGGITGRTFEIISFLRIYGYVWEELF